MILNKEVSKYKVVDQIQSYMFSIDHVKHMRSYAKKEKFQFKSEVLK